MGYARQESESIELAVFLALAGGLMDCYSYLVRDHVFANAQTGNMLLFGVNLASGNWDQCVHYIVPVLCFALGIAVCHVIKLLARMERLHWRQLALFIEIIVLVYVAFVPEGHSLRANGLTSFACGIQVQAFRKFHGRALATTMCIGNLRSGTQAFVSYMNTNDGEQFKSGLLSYFVIVCFVLGAVVGNWFIPVLGTRMILVGVALLTVSFLIMFVDREKRHVEELVEADLEADLEGEVASPRVEPELHGIAAMEERFEEREAKRIEERMGADIELNVMHDMGLTSQEAAEPASPQEQSVEKDVEAQIEARLRDHVKHGGFRAGK